MKKLILLFWLCLVLLSCGKNKKPAETSTDPGKEIFTKYCLACHQTDGSGVPGMYPTLQKTEWVLGDKPRLIGLLLNGQKGVITVNDRTYKGEMPSHQYLKDEQVAQVLTFIRSNFGNNAGPVTSEEVALVRSQSPKSK
jgi:mono/diheme cytochrome c family protein